MWHKIVVLLAAALGLFGIATASLAQDVYVRGHYRSDGTYVSPHYRTAPDSNPFNNYSTKGNVNPYTGKIGTVNPYRGNSSSSGSYGSSGTFGKSPSYGGYGSYGNTGRSLLYGN